MEQHAELTQSDDPVFTIRGAVMGFIAYLVVGLIVVCIV